MSHATTSVSPLKRGELTECASEDEDKGTSAPLPFDQAEITGSIITRFARVVNQFPDHLAVKFVHQTLTYRELDEASNQVAHAILTQREEEAEPVVLLLEHGVSPIVAILGVLKSGKFYVALDPSIAHARLIGILNDLQPGLIITNDEYFSLATELNQKNCQLINLAKLDPDLSKANIDRAISPESLAMLFYTSGSTGQPKGMMWTHSQVVYNTWVHTETYNLCPQDRQTLLFFCDFGVSVANIFNTFLNGATLYPYNPRATGIAQLLTWLRQEEITLFHPSVSIFRQLLDLLTGKETFPQLRLVILGGQPLYKQDVERFREHFPAECRLMHQMGSTEIGLITRLCIDQNTEITGNRVPVGYVTPEKEILVLNENGQEIGFNQVGEIAVRIRYLSPGYWNKPDLTRQKFVPDPEGGDMRIYLTGDLGRMQPDGCLEHLGRKDFQVKIRGYRVELAEIEAALYGLDAVKDAVVETYEQDPGDKRLVAYLVPFRQPAPTVTELRRALAKTLPEYMIPSVFVMLQQFPLTSTGKVDRQALPVPQISRSALEESFTAPQDEIELQLTKVWEQVFGFRPIGVRDNFFDLGGHSILALRLVAQIEKALGKPLPLPTLLQAPTIAQLAEILRQEGWTPPWSSLVALQPGGSKPPFFCVPPGAVTALHIVNFARHLGPDQPFYGLQPLGMDRDDVAPHTRVKDMATYYLNEIRQLQPEGPYYLGGQCFGGIVAFEMAQQLVAQGQPVALLAILDTRFPPGVVKTKSSPGELVRHYWQRGRQAWYEGEFWQVGGRKLKHWLRKYGKRKQLAKLWQRVVRPIKGTMERLHPRDEVEIIQKQRIKRVQKAHSTARWTYEPCVYPGKITFFWSRDTRRGLRHEWARWSTEALEIHVCPGRHNTMMLEPHVRVVAEKLRTCIEQAHAAASNQAQTNSHRQRDAPSA